MMGYYNDGFSGMFGFGGILMIVFWGLVIWGIFALVRGGMHAGNSSHKEEDRALAILKERYAKGEISKEEFEEKKGALLK